MNPRERHQCQINHADSRGLGSGAEVGRQIRARLEASLTRLGTEHVELHYQHPVSPSIPVEEVAVVLGELIAEGKIGAGSSSRPSGLALIRRTRQLWSSHGEPLQVHGGRAPRGHGRRQDVGDKLENVLNEHAAQGWQLKAITSVEVKGRVGPGGVEGLLVTFERPVG